MSVFETKLEGVEIDTLNNILKKYDANDIDLDENPDSHLRADRILYLLDKIKKEIRDDENQKLEAITFWDDRIEKKIKNSAYLEEMLEYYMSQNEKKTIKLPNGTLRVRKSKKFNYPDADVLLEFSHFRKLETNITEKPNLKVIKEYITNTGDHPDGLVVEENSSFSYSLTTGER